MGYAGDKLAGEIVGLAMGKMCMTVYPFEIGERLVCSKPVAHEGAHWAKGDHAEFSWPQSEPKPTEGAMDTTLNEMVRDFTQLGSRPKSEVRRRIVEYALKLKAEGAEKAAEIKRPDKIDIPRGNGNDEDGYWADEADAYFDALESRNAELQRRCNKRFNQLANMLTRHDLMERKVERLTQDVGIAFNEGVDASIAFVMSGRFLSDEAPTAKFAREVAENLPRIKRTATASREAKEGMPEPLVSDDKLREIEISSAGWFDPNHKRLAKELIAWRKWAAGRGEGL